MLSFFPLAALLITAVVGLVSFYNWRYGLLCVIAIGLLQDVFRKLTPGVPAYFIVWSAAVFGMVIAISVINHGMPRLRQVWLNDNVLKAAFSLYFVLVAIQCIHSLVRWGNLVYPVFGLIFYIGPVVALMFMIAYAKNNRWIRRYMLTYLWIMVPASLSIYLSLFYKDMFPVLRDVGSFLGRELIIYDVGTILYSYPGLFRVGEIAAFHATVCIAFLSMLMLERDRIMTERVFQGVLILLLIGAVILTGRRKMLMTISIFWVFQFFLLAAWHRGVSRLAVAAVIVGVLISVGIGVFSEGASSGLYLQRGTSVFTSVDDRVGTAVMLFFSAIGRSDGIGLGAGIASQGTRFAGVGDISSYYVGGAGESGIGYVVVELGIPGLMIILWLGFNLVRVLKNKLRMVARVDYQAMLYMISFISLLGANIATFAVATQLYGDYFVLITLGVIAGLLYASINQAVVKVATIAVVANKDQSPVQESRHVA